MTDDSWSDFGTHCWRGDRLRTHTRPHVATHATNSSNHVGTDRQFPINADSNQAPKNLEQLLGACKACVVQLAVSTMLCGLN